MDLVNVFMSDGELSEGFFLIDVSSGEITRESASCAHLMDDFGPDNIRSVVRQIATETSERTVCLPWLSACPEARLAGMERIKLRFAWKRISENQGLVTVRPDQSYRQLRERYAVVAHAIEQLDGGVSCYRLDVTTGLSTAEFTSKMFVELTGTDLTKLPTYGIAEVGSRVPDGDRAISDAVLRNAISRLTWCDWPLRFRIRNELHWRRYFARTWSVDGKTIVITAITRDFTHGAAEMNLTDSPGVREYRDADGELRFEPVSTTAPRVEDDHELATDVIIEAPASATTHSDPGSDSPPNGEKSVLFPLSRCMKHRLVTILSDSLCRLQSPLGDRVVSIEFPLPSPSQFLEEIMLLVTPDEQEALHRTFKNRDTIGCSEVLSRLMKTREDWLVNPGCVFEGHVGDVMLCFHLLLSMEVSQAASGSLVNLKGLIKHARTLGSTIGQSSEACLMINIALAILTLSKSLPDSFAKPANRSWLASLVSAAAETSDRCWDDAGVQLLMFWLSHEWGVSQKRIDYQIQLLTTCVEDLNCMMESFSHSGLLDQLRAVASHNLETLVRLVPF